MKKVSCFLCFIIVFIVQGQTLAAMETKLQTELTIKDLTFGVRFEYTEYMASSIHIGSSINMNTEGIPLGFVARIRQSFFLPKLPIELAICSELEAFNSDTGFLILPSIGANLGVRFTLLKQDFLFSVGYRFGFTEYLESYKGELISVKRIDRINAFPLYLGLIWKI